MGLNIENPEVESLVEEIARLTGESKTEAVRTALLERRSRLPGRTDESGRGARLLAFFEAEVWPLIPEGGGRLTPTEEEALLGYGPDGV